MRDVFHVLVRNEFVVGDMTNTLICEVLGAVVNPDAPVYSQSKPIHHVKCLLTGHSAMITEIPPEKFNMGTKKIEFVEFLFILDCV